MTIRFKIIHRPDLGWRELSKLFQLHRVESYKYFFATKQIKINGVIFTSYTPEFIIAMNKELIWSHLSC